MFQLSRHLSWFLLYLIFGTITPDFSVNSAETDLSLEESNERNKNQCNIVDENGVDQQVEYSKSSASNNEDASKHLIVASGIKDHDTTIPEKKFLVQKLGNLTFLAQNSLQRTVTEFFWKYFAKHFDADHNRLVSQTDSLGGIFLKLSNRMVAVESKSKACFIENLSQFSSGKSPTIYLREKDDAASNFKNEIFRHLDFDHIEFGHFHNENSNDPSGVTFDDDVCVILYVYSLNRDDGNKPSDQKLLFTYELVDPIDLQLGMTVRHTLDFAYMPVMSSASDHASEETDFSSLGEITEFSPRLNDGKSNEVLEADTSLIEGYSLRKDDWWQWLIPSQWWKDKIKRDKFSSDYRKGSDFFAGGSHGEVWRGRRKCNIYEQLDPKNLCDEKLIFKRLRVEAGFHLLEAGLREVYYGSLLSAADNHEALARTSSKNLFTEYVEHFFGQHGELWIVFRDAGHSLRHYLYTAADVGDYVVFQHSRFWTLLRTSVAKKRRSETRHGSVKHSSNDEVAVLDEWINIYSSASYRQKEHDDLEDASIVGRELMRSVLRQILEAAAYLHDNGIVHRDIKPSNVMCQTNFDPEGLKSLIIDSPTVHCVLGDFSSAYNDFTKRHLYSNGPSRNEQTDEYAPPEAIFGQTYSKESSTLSAAFDSWSIGIVALELLLGSPNVFSVDQRTRAVLSHKMQKRGATPREIEKAMYLAALSQFCIYNPWKEKGADWPLGDGEPLHKSAMTKKSCTLDDFHRALRARDPLGLGFSDADTLLHLIWQLLAWDPNERITASDALRHPYFTGDAIERKSHVDTSAENALESQTLDPRMDFNTSVTVSEFRCPKCGRVFTDWKSCSVHAKSRKHANFCSYDKSSLPSCLHAHYLLPAHSLSGYCDIQGRRSSIEDFHAIHLLPTQQFYGIFDGHLGNLASKYVASFLHKELSKRLDGLLVGNSSRRDWKELVEDAAIESFDTVHKNFLEALTLAPYGFMDNSGTTATAAIITNSSLIIASLGDSRAIISSRNADANGKPILTAVQLTTDHQASNPEERIMVESLGGTIVRVNGVDRVNGILAITRSIGDAKLQQYLSRKPQVLAMTREEVKNLCGERNLATELNPCFLIVASDGLWDTVSNQEAVDMVAEVITEEVAAKSVVSWRESVGLQKAAEALTLESFVRGSTDNIGVCIIALD